MLAGYSTKREIAEWFSIDDLADGNDALDAQDDAVAELRDRNRKE